MIMPVCQNTENSTALNGRSHERFTKMSEGSSVISSNNKKLDSIQALRALAFAGVFIGHFFICGWSHIAVSTFFVLSGFLLTIKTPNDYETCSFATSFKKAVKRISKLYPVHIVTMLMMLPCMIWQDKVLQTFDPVKYIKQVVLNIFVVSSLYPSADIASSLNRVAWFLSSLFVLYIIFPYLYRLLNRIKGVHSHVLIILISIAVQTMIVYLIFGGIYDENLLVYLTHISPFYRIFDMVCGISLGLIIRRIPGEKELGKVTAAVIEIAVFLFFLFQVYLTDSGATSIYLYRAPFCPAMGVIFTLLFYRKKGPVTKLLTNRLTVFVGNMSGYAYLIHFPVIFYFNIFVVMNLTSLRRTIIHLVVLPLTLGITFGGSYLYDRFISKRK